MAALEGTDATIKNNNVGGLVQFCKAFGFQDLATWLSHFQESGDFKEEAVHLSALGERMTASRHSSGVCRCRSRPWKQ
jgi:hypothetical protein